MQKQKFEVWRFHCIKDLWVYVLVVKERLSLLEYATVMHYFKPELLVESNTENQTVITRHPASNFTYHFKQLQQFYPNLVKKESPTEHVIINCHINDFNVQHLSCIFVELSQIDKVPM